MLLVQSNFNECLVAVALEDAVTLQTILQRYAVVTTKATLTAATTNEISASSMTSSFPVLDLEFASTKQSPNELTTSKRLKVTLIPVPEDCGGSAEAVRWIEQQQRLQQDQPNGRIFLPRSSHLLIIPGDLVLLDSKLLRQMVDEHVQQHIRAGAVNINQFEGALVPPPAPACTMLLVNVGELDEHGIPLKESAKVRTNSKLQRR